MGDLHLGGDVSAGAEVGLTDIASADVAAGGAAGTLLAGNPPEGREVGAGVNGGGLDDAAFEGLNKALGRLERFWVDQILYKL